MNFIQHIEVFANVKLPLSKKISNTKNPIDLYCDTVPLRILFCQQNICDNTQGPCLFGKVYMVNYAFPIRNWYNTFVVFPIKVLERFLTM